MAENTIITLTSPDGATLNTAGTYCENDIEVIPKLQEKTATTGEIVTADDGYVGLKSVDTTPVFEAGQKSEYDAFWDAFQENGNRTNYNMAFAGASWTPEILKPKYPIRPNDGGRSYSYEGASMFERFGKKHNGERPLYDWKDITANMDIDFSSVSHPIRTFSNANITNIDVDLSNAIYMNQTFCHNDCGCESSHGFISIRLKITEKCIGCSLPFGHSKHLEELIFTDDSTIAFNGIDTSWSPLNKASLTSIVNALSSTTTGLTVTLRLAAVNTAFETSAGAADGSNSEEWLALAATKPNWTINLINS